MDKLVIEGGKPLSGTIVIQGAKNAALPILAASLLAEGTLTMDHVPDLLDIDVMLNILRELGCRAEHAGGTVVLNTETAHTSHVPEMLMRQMRSSVFLMGPLLASFGEAQVYQPGGCAIGERRSISTCRACRRLVQKLRNRAVVLYAVRRSCAERIFI